MKKVIFLFPGLLIMLWACNDISSQPLITILSDGETISTYESVLWDSLWDGKGFLLADCVPAGAMLPKIADELSVVTYADDFMIQYREDVTFSYIRIFDENFERLYNAVELSYLEKLPEGNYYVVIQVIQQGRYIISEKQYELSGMECTLKLVVD